MFTISDVNILAKLLFFLPGDWLLTFVACWLPNAAVFFEIDGRMLGGVSSFILSLVFWLFVLLLFAFGYEGFKRRNP